MPIQFSFEIPDSTDVVSGQFTDADWSALIAFRAEWERFRQTEWIANDMPAQVQIEWTPESGLVLNTPNKPSNAQFGEFLHGLRPFILNNEPHYWPKAFNILRRAIQHPWMREVKKREQGRFEGDDIRQLITVRANGLPLTAKETLHLWLNAFEYHRDDDKVRAYVDARGGPPEEIDLAFFRLFMVSKVDVIIGLVGMITWIDNHPNTMKT